MASTNNPTADLGFQAIIHPESYIEEVSDSEDDTPKTKNGNKHLGGAILSPRKNHSQFKINLSTILISACIFIGVLTWAEFAQAAFIHWFDPKQLENTIKPMTRLAYATALTVFLLAVAILIYHYSYQAANSK